MQLARETDWKKAVKDEYTIEDVVAAMGEFQQRFCDHMIGNRDFTLALEIHGDQGKVIHVRFRDDSFRRHGSSNGSSKSGGKKFARD